MGLFLFSFVIDTEDLMKEGLTNRQIGLLTAEGKLEKVAHGHYWIISPEFSKPEDYKAVEVARVNRKAVICADSACYYMGLIDKEPEILSIATPHADLVLASPLNQDNRNKKRQNK